MTQNETDYIHWLITVAVDLAEAENELAAAQEKTERLRSRLRYGFQARSKEMKDVFRKAADRFALNPINQEVLEGLAKL